MILYWFLTTIIIFLTFYLSNNMNETFRLNNFWEIILVYAILSLIGFFVFKFYVFKDLRI